jgi:hypothetical protein
VTSLDGIRSSVVGATERGWYVVPVPPSEKRPNLPRWQARGSNDPAHVAAAWRGPWAGYNYAILTGPSELVVVDADTSLVPPERRFVPGVRNGLDVLAFLLEAAGENRVPETYWVRSGRGGWHLYFQAPQGGPEIRNSAGALGPGVDVRAVGGCVIGDGSVVCGYRMPTGEPVELRCELLDGRGPRPLPSWLARRLAPQPSLPFTRAVGGTAEGRFAGLLRTVREARPGDRTGPLVWAAHRLREMVAAGQASAADGEALVQAAVAAGIDGGARYARYQVEHVLKAGGPQ